MPFDTSPNAEFSETDSIYVDKKEISYHLATAEISKALKIDEEELKRMMDRYGLDGYSGFINLKSFRKQGFADIAELYVLKGGDIPLKLWVYVTSSRSENKEIVVQEVINTKETSLPLPPDLRQGEFLKIRTERGVIKLRIKAIKQLGLEIEVIRKPTRMRRTAKTRANLTAILRVNEEGYLNGMEIGKVIEIIRKKTNQ